MKLDIACIRDILLCLEDCLVLTDELEYKLLGLHEICQTGNLQNTAVHKLRTQFVSLKKQTL